MFSVPEIFRIRTGRLGTSAVSGNNGAFQLVLRDGSRAFAISSDGMGWEHVSVSMPNRCLTWDEMCQVKDMFWSPEDCVVQYHPPKSEYVNVHPFTLHLWRARYLDMPRPLPSMVG